MSGIKLFEFSEFNERPVVEPEPEPIDERALPQYNDYQMEEATRHAFEQGTIEGVKQAEEGLARIAADLANNAVQQLQFLLEAEDKRDEKAEKEAIKLAVLLAKHLVPQLMSRHPMEEIDNILGQVLALRVEEPRITLKVHPMMVEEVKSRFTVLAEQAGFSGKYLVLAEAGLQPPDIKAEWQSGGMERLINQLWDQAKDLCLRAVE
ncbi:MAG: hypothetical protein ACOYK8_08045 [Alphaproteobacteria bacterium]